MNVCRPLVVPGKLGKAIGQGRLGWNMAGRTEVHPRIAFIAYLISRGAPYRLAHDALSGAVFLVRQPTCPPPEGWSGGLLSFDGSRRVSNRHHRTVTVANGILRSLKDSTQLKGCLLMSNAP